MGGPGKCTAEQLSSSTVPQSIDVVNTYLEYGTCSLYRKMEMGGLYVCVQILPGTSRRHAVAGGGVRHATQMGGVRRISMGKGGIN